MASTKVCITCKKRKRVSEFGHRAIYADGLQRTCRECHNDYMRRWQAKRPRDARRRYAVQKGDAKRRGIPFLLTFEQWLKVWVDSGRYHESGSYSGQYCMARLGDVGPYALGNVRICTCNENASERRMSVAARAKIAENNRVRFKGGRRDAH